MSVIVLSPHIDDAVFSCWHLLKKGATVINIFAGVPPSGTATLWDRVCGQPDSAAMMRTRLKENTNVFKHIDISSSNNLEYLDRQYEHSKRNLDEIAESVFACADYDSEFFAPIAASKLWNHPDHVATRELGKHLLGLGKKVSFYADIPYMRIPSHPTTNYIQRASRRASKLGGLQLPAEIIELSPHDQTLKRKCMHLYKSQYNMINFVSLGTISKKVNVQREMVFHHKP